VRALLAVLLVLAAPAAALACPTCATREGPGLGVLLAVGAMIACPFVIAAVAIRVVRRLERRG
jgi:hypothetical protein